MIQQAYIWKTVDVLRTELNNNNICAVFLTSPLMLLEDIKRN